MSLRGAGKRLIYGKCGKLRRIRRGANFRLQREFGFLGLGLDPGFKHAATGASLVREGRRSLGLSNREVMGGRLALMRRAAHCLCQDFPWFSFCSAVAMNTGAAVLT